MTVLLLALLSEAIVQLLSIMLIIKLVMQLIISYQSLNGGYPELKRFELGYLCCYY